jgi:hypothetical protein
MDEVDGRPGPVARKSGHLDASNGVPPLSLSLPRFTPEIKNLSVSFGSDRAFSSSVRKNPKTAPGEAQPNPGSAFPSHPARLVEPARNLVLSRRNP